MLLRRRRRPRPPVVTRVTPMHVAIGQKLEIRGRYFRRGRNKNTVVFKRTGGKAIFVKADVGTTKLLRLTVPTKLKAAARDARRRSRPDPLPPPRARQEVRQAVHEALALADRRAGAAARRRRRRRVRPPMAIATATACSNGVETDDDGDLVDDNNELRYKTDGCKADSDGDGVTDGYEIQSARDLNDDEYQFAQSVLPYPEKRPYPNALFADANVDYDGDSLTLGEEFSLWQAYRDHAGLDPLIYSDGNQYSALRPRRRGPPAGRPAPRSVRQAGRLPRAGPSGAGYLTVSSGGSSYDLRDFNHDGTVSTAPVAATDAVLPLRADATSTTTRTESCPTTSATRTPTASRTSTRRTADCTPGYWSGCYGGETPYPVAVRRHEHRRPRHGRRRRARRRGRPGSRRPREHRRDEPQRGDQRSPDRQAAATARGRSTYTRRRPGQPVQPLPAEHSTHAPARGIRVSRALRRRSTARTTTS